MASLGLLTEAPTYFKSHQSVQYAGVLFSLPALESQGLSTFLGTYGSLDKGYYGLTHVVLLLSMMALCRIKNPEQLKNHPPGELGRLLGLDRSPETKCLRIKVRQMVSLGKAESAQQELLSFWLGRQWCDHFYVDGHVRVYHGDGATLPKRYVSRQKLCLAGSTEYWVNDGQGLPLMSVAGELNGKLREAITGQLLPVLLGHSSGFVDEETLSATPDMPRFTLVFDREAYEPAFFRQLWESHRVAVITYRKNVTGFWEEECFGDMSIPLFSGDVTMRICERETVIKEVVFREVRCLSDNGHQTSIITTNRIIDTAQVAANMFSRWNQENYFRYMLQEFDLDRIIEYGSEPENPDKSVINPPYRMLSNRLKKAREKKARLQAKIFASIEEHLDSDLEAVAESLGKQAGINEKIQEYEKQIAAIITERDGLPSRVALKDMPEEKRYNRQKKESKLLINIIRMIAYRAETAMTNLIRPYYANSGKDGRTLLKEIFTSPADIYPDYENKTLTVMLHSMSNPRRNKAVAELCSILTDTQTIYPKTDLKIIYKSMAV